MNKGNNVMLAVVVAFGITLVAGLIATPTIENAQASQIGDRVNDEVKMLFPLVDIVNNLICAISGCSS
jgi:uncharacterized membrane protein YjgN (DUF898 family)